ncbi:MAG: hypothetical protein EZS28_032048 [Streblomastix strix]|uniref:Uncharacterized protein n=1 Tax=Streblomastix strix TaxID=222440 RepID=A0A5J4URJ7_9EUKA|nr:MAG: hypothetical protein EZS28_032048 [Streblomastix strix]
MKALFDGSYIELIICGPFQSILQNKFYELGASVPTNAIIQSPAFVLASGGQLLIKYPFRNRPVVSFDTVNVILLPQTISYRSETLDDKKLYCFNYELKSNFVIAFGIGGSNSSFDAQIITSLFFHLLLQSSCPTRQQQKDVTDAGLTILLVYETVYNVNSTNDDNIRLPPPANKTDESSMPFLTNTVALTLALNVFVPFIDQLLVVLTQFVSFESTADIVKYVLATGSYVSSYVAQNGFTYFSLPVIFHQIESSNFTYLLSMSVFEYDYIFVQQFDNSVGVLANSKIGLILSAPSNTKLSPAHELINDDPVIVAIPSIQLTNLQLLLNILFAFIDYAVPKVIQQLKSTSSNSTYDINQSVSILIQAVD